MSWQVTTPGYGPRFTTEVEGTGPDLTAASAATWAAAVDELLDTPAFVQEQHYGPLSGYDCVFAAHFVVGASMLGIKLTQGERARVHWTGNGVAMTGRF